MPVPLVPLFPHARRWFYNLFLWMFIFIFDTQRFSFNFLQNKLNSGSIRPGNTFLLSIRPPQVSLDLEVSIGFSTQN